jgi:acyl-CoA synthetase (AMP-forming)/AMP-acid ligase II/acyl carrier protein
MRSPETMGELIAVQGARRGAACALAMPGRPPLSYAELAASVEQTAIWLCEAGVRRGDRVVTVLPSSMEMAVLMFAVTAVATLAPLNPALTEHELERELRRLRPALVITMDNSRAVTVAGAAGTCCFQLCPDPGSGGQFSLVRVIPSVNDRAVSGGSGSALPQPGDNALILSTSGTTSTPKLVPLTHANVLAAASATQAAYGLGIRDSRLNIMPLFHVQGLVGALTACVLAGAEMMCTESFDPADSVELIESFRPAWLSASPAMYIEMLRRLRRRKADVSSLRFVRVGSAALHSGLRAELEDCFGVPVIESYGMTEAHQIASTPMPPLPAKTGMIGPATGSKVMIVGEGGQLCPPGETGEILVSGPNVMHGYLEDPAANAAAFTGGWLRTGDLGWVDDDGYVALSGRLKELINCGGEKIAPQEVEAALLAHPGVREGAAFALPHPVLQEQVAAAVVTASGHAFSESGLRQFLSERIAPFKVPRRIVQVDAIPKTASGKARRATLAETFAPVLRASEPDTRGDQATVDVTSPGDAGSWSPTETALAALWRSVLKVPKICRDDDFFVLGGDSLTGVELLAAVEEVFGVEVLPLSMYDEASTVMKMAAFIEARRAERHGSGPLR